MQEAALHENPQHIEVAAVIEASALIEVSAGQVTTEETILTWAFEHSSDGMLITDLGGVITRCNAAFLEMFGYTRAEVIGSRTRMLRSSKSTDAFYAGIWSSLQSVGEWKGEICNLTNSGAEKICFLSITSIYSPDGRKLGYLGVEIDLTERKRLEDQVIQGEKLAGIGESLATLMHEIRNPINGISMNIYMLRENASHDEGWSEEERESIELISKEVKRLDVLIRDALSYARKVDLHPQRYSVSVLFDEIRELLVYKAQEQDVDLVIDKGTGLHLGYFDPDLMKQVLLNLVQNAIEAAAPPAHRGGRRGGRVRLRVQVEDKPEWQYISASGKVLLLSVENSGEAIPYSIRSSLFKPFFTTKSHGLGLGLATSAKIVRQHHGIIQHANAAELPYSTIFTVALPK
ncbi:MAG: PAS domain S-box protein [Ignavibacteriota bacterium]